MRVNEASLGNEPDATVLQFLNTCERDGFFKTQFKNLPVRLDLTVFFVAKRNFLDDDAFLRVTGERQAGYARVKAIQIVNGAAQREGAFTGTFEEMSARKLSDKAGQLRGLVTDLGLDSADADRQWHATQATAAEVGARAARRLATISELTEAANCSMGVVRDVAKDLYTRLEAEVERGRADAPVDERDQLWIGERLRDSMTDPAAPAALLEKLDALRARLGETQSAAGQRNDAPTHGLPVSDPVPGSAPIPAGSGVPPT